jgi:hypothetical protein
MKGIYSFKLAFLQEARMRVLIGMLLLLPFVGACSDVRMLGATAAEQRRVMNDMQARATLAAVCDISLGAYLRELSAVERRYAGLVCGDVEAMQEALSSTPLPAQLRAAEPAALVERRPGQGDGSGGEGGGALD